jgi:PE family
VGAIAGLFNSHALEYQSLSAEASAFHARFVAALTAGAQWYPGAEASSASTQAGYEPWTGSVGAGVSNFNVSVNGVS